MSRPTYAQFWSAAPDPYFPPRRFFVDGGHYAAYLAMLDGMDRLRAAWVCGDADGRVFFAQAAQDSFDMVRQYLGRSDIDSLGARPDYAMDTILASTGRAEIQVQTVLRTTPAAPILRREVGFALVIPAPRAVEEVAEDA